jgi:hypothetical protein
MPTALDNGMRSPRKLLAAVVRKLVAALRPGRSSARFAPFAAALALVATACGGGEPTVITEPVTVTVTDGETAEEPSTTAEETTEAETGAAGVGDTITLHGNDDRLVMAVKLMEVVDPDESYDKGEFSF